MSSGYDVQIIPGTSGEVVFSVRGKATDSALLLLQRLYVLLFSNMSGAYRGGDAGVDVLELLDGANVLADEALEALLNMAATYALSALDQEDRDMIESFDCVCVDGRIISTLEMTDGTVLEGSIDNA